MEFGEEIRKNFSLTNDVTFINHGSFGAVPRCVKDAQKRLLDEMDKNPDLWFRKTNAVKINEARHCIAEFIHSDPDDVVFVQNITTGMNSVIKSLPLEADDVIVCTDNAYSSVKNTCNKLSRVTGVKIVYLTVRFPIISEDDVVQMFRQFFTNTRNVKAAVLDHISCCSAIKWPIEKLIPVCREFGVLSIIDGAHTPGHVPLNIKELNPDIYIGTLHKWLFCPRACAILYVNKKHQDWVEPAIIGLGYRKTFLDHFYDQGCRDQIPFCVVPEAVKFYKDLGGYEKMKSYIDNLLEEATNLMTSTWGTEKLPIPKSMEAPFMKMIRLPPVDMIGDVDNSLVPKIQKVLMMKIIEELGIVTCLTLINGHVYIRCSCNVYNTMKDYIKMVDEIQKRRK